MAYLLLLALGLASATTTGNVKKMDVFGIPSMIDMDMTSFFGTRSMFPLNSHPYSINPIMPYNIYPIMPNMLRNWELPSTSFNLRDAYTKPVVVVMKSKDNAEGLTTYMLEYGLSSLADNPNTRFIHDMIKSGSEKTAVVVHPTVLHNTPAFKILKDMVVDKVEVPKGIKFGNLIHTLRSKMPFVFIHDKEDVNTFDFDGLIRFGSLDIHDEKIICTSCY